MIELNRAIENLYRTFSKYPLDKHMSACPCCIRDNDKLTLYTPALENLTADELGRYAFKALTTWGDAKDYKHFLPRLLELVAQGENIDLDLLWSKLQCAEWENWQESEKVSVQQFFLAHWHNFLSTQSCIGLGDFLVLYKITQNLTLLLTIWDSALAQQDKPSFAFDNLVWMLIYDYRDLVNFDIDENDMDDIAQHQLLHWLNSKKLLIEKIFYNNEIEDFDYELANAIENYELYSQSLE